MFMSAPSLVWKAAVQLFASGEIWNDLRVSGIEFGWGYFLSVIVGVPFGIACGWYKKMAYIFDPFINAMNATPRVALLPLVIIWLGIGILSKVGIIFLGAVFPILINSRDGVKTTPYNLLTARQELRRFRMADLPECRSPFNSSVYSYRLKAWRWPRPDWRHGRGIVRRNGGHWFYDHRRRGDLPNR